MSFADSIKAKIKDVDVEKQLTGLVDEGEKLVKDAVTKAGDVAHDKRDDVEGWLTKAQEAVNEKTDGKYADQVTKVRDTLMSGLEKLAQRRTPDAPAQTSEPIELPPVDGTGSEGPASDQN